MMKNHNPERYDLSRSTARLGSLKLAMARPYKIPKAAAGK